MYYYSVYGRNIDPAGGDYQFRVYAVDRYLSNVSPNTGGNAGELSVRITGLPFESGMQAELRSDGLPTIVASEVIVESGSSLWAKFDLTGATPGYMMFMRPGQTLARNLAFRHLRSILAWVRI